jgi:hypothetical protein
MTIDSDLYDTQVTIMPRLLAGLIFQPAMYIVAMEIIESIGWIALGFVPTLVAMEVAWKAGGKRKPTLMEAKVR